REALVDERVVGGNQIDDAAVVAQLALEKQRRLLEKRRAQVFVELRKDVGVREMTGCLPDAEPLAAETLHQSARAGIAQHACDLLLQDLGIRELLANRQTSQLVVRNTAPQEKRQSRREIEIAQSVDRAR